MNTIKKIYSLALLGIIILIPHHTFALKQAVFPNAQSLQPLPADAYPNISGNTNSEANTPPLYQQDIAIEGQPENIEAENVAVDPKPTRMMIWPFVIILGILIFGIYQRMLRNKKII